MQSLIRKQLADLTIKLDKAKEKEYSTSDELVKLVVFSLNEETYAIEINQVVEIDRMMEITSVPNSPDYILGLIDLRGEILPVVDPEKKFLLKRETPAPSHYLIICKSSGGLFGLVVDTVSQIVSFPKKEINEAPDIIKSKIKEDFLKGVGVFAEHIFIILDTEKMLLPEEIKKIKSA